MARRRIKTIEEESEESLNRGIKILESYKSKLNEEREKRLNEQNNKKVNSAQKAFRWILLIVIIILAILFINYGPILGIKVVDLKEEPKVINNILSNESIYLEYNNELLIYSSSEVATYNAGGKKTWSYSLEDSFAPSVYANGKYLVIANKSNGMIYYFSSKKEIANKIIDGNIENIYIADDGRFAVQYTKDSGYKKVIALYDTSAKLQYTEAYINSSPIIGIEFLTEKNKLLVVQADSELINIGTIFSVLNLEGEVKLEEIFKLEDKLVYNYKLVNDDIIYISNLEVERFNIVTKERMTIHSLSNSQINFITLYNNYFVTVETKESGYEIVSKKFDNTVIASNVLSVLPKYVEMGSLLTYVVSENSISIINKWGVIVDEIDISLSPKDVIIFNNEKAVALVYSNKIEIIKL